jgi:hypothetical protein
MFEFNPELKDNKKVPIGYVCFCANRLQVIDGQAIYHEMFWRRFTGL